MNNVTKNAMNNVVEFTAAGGAAVKADCRHCGQASQCFSNDLPDAELDRFAGAVKRRRVVQRGEHLFLQGEAFDTLYMLRSGSVKSYAVDVDGDEQVLGFHLTGDVLGLVAVGDGAHQSSAVALDTVSVCELSFSRLEAMGGDGADQLQRRLNRLFGEEIARDQALLRLIGKKSAEQRLCGFLNELSCRYAERGYAANAFNLSMSRHDIGDYLGLALETVSRLLGRLQKQGVLEVDRRAIKVLDREALASLAGAGSIAPALEPAQRRQQP